MHRYMHGFYTFINMRVYHMNISQQFIIGQIYTNLYL